MAPLVKICGITRPADAELAVAVGADIIGLNFYAPSPRCVALERAQAIRAAVAGRCLVAGVFVNATRDFIEVRRRELALDLLQFHGDEPDNLLRGWPVRVIRALRLKPGAPFELPRGSADYLLLDTLHANLFGGTGQSRSVADLRGTDLTRVILAGGLTPDNVTEAAALAPFAVDVASGVEAAPGVKDPDKLRSFIRHAKSTR